ncbi:hypothetical protein Pogu_0588 [Pyrobaculum oguniense TE7]|uniref:Uncharacterized protein n=1 Tax=Pyrobaculum oguniense (strain DSM 13380 / JCM 10595 / TE7) TaxID=698757 RepID=H6Q7V8_PYROT|nr:hypothetical protein Pogu_0588 [Pyrobaculum oguniense TE7]
MVGKIKTIGKIIGPILKWMGPPVRVYQTGEWTFFESHVSPTLVKMSQRAVSGKLGRELCFSSNAARYIKASDVVEITEDYHLVVNGITRIRLVEDACKPVEVPQFEPLAVSTLPKAQFDAAVERLLRARPFGVEVSAGERGIVLRASGRDEAEAAFAAAVRQPLEPAYVDADIFKAVRDAPLVGRVEIRLGGEPVKAEAAGRVRYKVSVIMIRAVGEVEYTVWWA